MLMRPALPLCLLITCLAATAPPAHSAPPSFRNDVMPVLSKAGCSLGTCHGNQHGKGGFKLSLRGQDPAADFITLTRSHASRRINPLHPADSLLLRKPLALVPHEGGRRLHTDNTAYRILHDWIAAGMPADPAATPTLVALHVEPAEIILANNLRSVQLQATAEFSDGTSRHVNELAVFESSSPDVTVTPAGEVQFPQSRAARQTSITVRYLDQQSAVMAACVPAQPDFTFTAPEPANVLDEKVFARLKKLQINPAPLCSDAVFVRRLYLDVTGQLPSAEQARRFIQSSAADKRSQLIDELLDSPGYIDFQTLRWCDLLRVEDKTLDAKGVEVFSHWIRACVSQDRPLHEFAADIVAGLGSTYSEPAANFHRALRTPEERAEAAAQVFLGVRLQCARCHNHPFDRWTQDDYYGWSAFFARIDYKILENRRRDINDKHEFDGEQIVFQKNAGEMLNPATGKPAPLRFLQDAGSFQTSTADSSDPARPDPHQDRLRQLAHWLRHPANSRFAATQANRIWFQLFGQGIVDPIDDFRATNPPANPELLQVLTHEFVRGGLQVKPLMRLILNSRTWQLASETTDNNRDDQLLFSHATPRRLTAEQLLDAFSHVLQTPVRFSGLPPGPLAVQISGVRTGGHRYSRPEAGDRFLALFGKPGRLLTCECERSAETTLAQTMELVGGEVLPELLKHPGSLIESTLNSPDSNTSFLDHLWWTALARAPSDAEHAAMLQYLQQAPARRQALEDITWAVLNSHEFLLKQ
ncbi:MAG: DUF1549 and DUF1553 domain-containing protein [Planctomycetota bacterium]